MPLDLIIVCSIFMLKCLLWKKTYCHTYAGESRPYGWLRRLMGDSLKGLQSSSLLRISNTYYISSTKASGKFFTLETSNFKIESL